MIRVLTLLAIVVGSASLAGAGDLLLENGSRVEGDLGSEPLVVITAAGSVEVSPEDVVALTRQEIRLRDGRLIRGVLAGDHVKVRTALGELAVRPAELRAYQVAPGAGSPTGEPPPGGGAGAGGLRGPGETAPGLAVPASYQDAGPVASRGGAAGAEVSNVAAISTSSAETRSRPARLEIVAESVLLRDAFAAASQVGRVVRGQFVTYVDFIDRRLRILNTLVFDGGYWVKVRVADGTEGWVPATAVREAR